MSDNTAIFLIMAVSVTAAVILAGITAWYRTRQRSDAQVAALNSDALRSENSELRDQVEHLEDRMAVLERIATDPATTTAREIESLR